MAIKTCSLGISKKLKELGFDKKEDSTMIWYVYQIRDEPNIIERIWAEETGLLEYMICPAPTISELLEELPEIKPDELFIIRKTQNKYDVDVLNCVSQDSLESLEDAIALLWIELKEKGLLETK